MKKKDIIYLASAATLILAAGMFFSKGNERALEKELRKPIGIKENKLSCEDSVNFIVYKLGTGPNSRNSRDIVGELEGSYIFRESEGASIPNRGEIPVFVVDKESDCSEKIVIKTGYNLGGRYRCEGWSVNLFESQYIREFPTIVYHVLMDMLDKKEISASLIEKNIGMFPEKFQKQWGEKLSSSNPFNN